MLGIARLAGPSADYYVEPEGPGRTDPHWPEPGGRWCGRGAEGLGCRGAVNPSQLEAVLAGCRPDGRSLADRRRTAAAGYDLTFSAPKSLSVLWALGDDGVRAHALAAHRSAVGEAMSYVEDRAVAVRRGSGPDRRLIGTGGVVAAAFDHAESRTGDPHLHSHVVTANLVQAEDGRWGSVDGRGLFAHAVAADRLYQAHLRHEISIRTALTWSRRPSGHFELDVVAPEVRGVLSGRQADIRSELAGRRGRAATRVAWATTRPDKAPAGDPGSRRAVWRDRAAAVGWPGFADRAPGSVVGPPVLDERAFAAALADGRPTALYRRDAVAAWCDGMAAGAPAGAVRQAVDRWLGPGDGPGLAEGRRRVADLVAAPHLIAALGPRPGTEPGLTAWCGGARVVVEYRRRFEVTDLTEALGVTRTGLSALPAGRLAAHLATVRQVDETRRHLGRPPWRQLDVVDLGRDRA